MTTTTHTNRTSSRSDTGSTTRQAGPIGTAVLGTMVVTAAFVALIVAGLAAADLYGTAGGDASDRGVWMATQAWATPLALTGLAVLFAGAVPLALSNIRSSISTRRDSMVSGLPIILADTTTNVDHHVNTDNKENIR